MAERVMVNLGTTLDAEVNRLAQQAGVTKGEVVRHAVRFYLPLEAAMLQGVAVVLVHADGRTEQFRPFSVLGTPVTAPLESGGDGTPRQGTAVRAPKD